MVMAIPLWEMASQQTLGLLRLEMVIICLKKSPELYNKLKGPTFNHEPKTPLEYIRCESCFPD